MSYPNQLSQAHWQIIEPILPGKKGDPGRTAVDNRRFIEGVLWIGENGGKWRHLPPYYGNWNSVFRRFRNWAKKGVWQKIFELLAQKANTKWLMVDATIVRAHHHAAGEKKRMEDNKNKP